MQQQTKKQAFLTKNKEPVDIEEYTETTEYVKLIKRLQKKYGVSPAEKLKKEIMTQKEIDKKNGRPNQEYTKQQLHEMGAILRFDMMKQGKIEAFRCPEHGDKYLLIRYQKSDGVHIRCKACRVKTHFDEFHFQGCDEHGDE
jgi:hypothetical protein